MPNVCVLGVCTGRYTRDGHTNSEPNQEKLSLVNNFFKVLLLSTCDSAVETGSRSCEERGGLGRDTGITTLKLIIKESKENR